MARPPPGQPAASRSPARRRPGRGEHQGRHRPLPPAAQHLHRGPRRRDPAGPVAQQLLQRPLRREPRPLPPPPRGGRPLIEAADSPGIRVAPSLLYDRWVSLPGAPRSPRPAPARGDCAEGPAGVPCRHAFGIERGDSVHHDDESGRGADPGPFRRGDSRTSDEPRVEHPIDSQVVADPRGTRLAEQGHPATPERPKRKPPAPPMADRRRHRRGDRRPGPLLRPARRSTRR